MGDYFGKCFFIPDNTGWFIYTKGSHIFANPPKSALATFTLTNEISPSLTALIRVQKKIPTQA